MTALQGRRVVVTRPRARAEELCTELAQRGASVIAFPTIETVRVTGGELERALGNLDGYDWIAFTSAAAVEAFVRRQRELRHRLPAGVRLAAVGPATAAALTAASLRVNAMPASHRGSALAGALGPLEGRRVLLPASRLARPETGAALRAAGAQVETVTVYDTVPATPEPTALAQLERGADAVTFTSPSTVAGFAQIGGAAARAILHAAVLACIGPTTASAARELGLVVRVEPARASAAALAAALEGHFAALLSPGRTP